MTDIVLLCEDIQEVNDRPWLTDQTTDHLDPDHTEEGILSIEMIEIEGIGIEWIEIERIKESMEEVVIKGAVLHHRDRVPKDTRSRGGTGREGRRKLTIRTRRVMHKLQQKM